MPSNDQCIHCDIISFPCSAACYDSINHCVWTSNDDWIDLWDCCGKARPAVHLLASRLGKTSTQDLIPVTDKSQKTMEGERLLLYHEVAPVIIIYQYLRRSSCS